jgi:hypothetical protein
MVLMGKQDGYTLDESREWESIQVCFLPFRLADNVTWALMTRLSNQHLKTHEACNQRTEDLQHRTISTVEILSYGRFSTSVIHSGYKWLPSSFSLLSYRVVCMLEIGPNYQGIFDKLRKPSRNTQANRPSDPVR